MKKMLIIPTIETKHMMCGRMMCSMKSIRGKQVYMCIM